jgi:hypothetical protein
MASMENVIILVGFLLIATAATLGGIWSYIRTLRFTQRAVKAEGQYVDASWQRSVHSMKSTQYGLIQFYTADGKEIQFQARLGTPFESRKIGRRVEVLYDPVKPQHAVVNSFVELWMPTVIILGTGVGQLIAIPLLVWLLGMPGSTTP